MENDLIKHHLKALELFKIHLPYCGVGCELMWDEEDIDDDEDRFIYECDERQDLIDDDYIQRVRDINSTKTCGY